MRHHAIVLAGLLGCALLAPQPAMAGDSGLAVIGYPGMPRLDVPLLQRLYTGRAVEVAGVVATPLNTPSSQPLRQRFLTLVLQQDDDQYRAYWTVRRHIGKGVPPRELASTAEVAAFVQATPGALGYIDAAEVRPGMNVVFKP